MKALSALFAIVALGVFVAGAGVTAAELTASKTYSPYESSGAFKSDAKGERNGWR